MSLEATGPGNLAAPTIMEPGSNSQSAGNPMLSASAQFDPNASPADKAAQFRAQVPNGADIPLRKTNPTALVSDSKENITPNVNLPPATKAGVSTDPGHDPATDGVDETDPIWLKTLGHPQFGTGNLTPKEANQTLLDEQTRLEGVLHDKFFGDWYHNAAIIIICGTASWLVGVIGGGVGWLMIIFAFCATYYRTSLRRVRRNFRDDINRQLAMTKIETDSESIEWINSFLVKFWPIYSPVVCATIIGTVDQVLSTSLDMLPPFVDSLSMKTFTLGSKPPRMELVKTYPKTEDDLVIMDWKFSFTPNDTADMTYRQLQVKQNPKVVLEARFGRGIVSKGMEVIVEDMSCVGHIRLKIKLQLAFPHIDRIDMCFLEPPSFDYVCKPVGGNFGPDINFIPGLNTFISNTVHDILRPMMYAPKVFPIEVAKMLAGNPIDQAIGVVSITLHGAEGLKNTETFGGTLDPYAIVKINNRDILGRTKHIEENANPKWNETINILVTSLSDSLTIPVFDYNEFRKDKEIGVATFPLDQLQHEQEYANQNLPVLSNGKNRGLIHCDIRYFPVLSETKLDDGTTLPPPESNTGILRFSVEQAKDLDASKSMIGRLNPYAVLLLNGKEVHITQKLKRTNQPVFANPSKEILITNRSAAKLGLMIKDDRDLATDIVVGSYQIKVDDILELMAKNQDWYNLAGVASGRVKMTAHWRPVALKGSIAGAGAYVTPIGVMRVRVKNARDLRNLETVGKSDPYVSLSLSGIQKARTVTFQNNLNPDWNEVFYIPVHSTREIITLDVMDEESVGADRSLGLTEIAVSNWAKKDEDGQYSTNDPVEVKRTLKSNPRDPGKGVLTFVVAFYPTIPVIDPEEEEAEKRKSGETVRATDDASSDPSGSQKTDGSDYVVLPKDVTVPAADGPDAGASPADDTDAAPEKPQIRLTPENVQEHESGLLVFRLLDGDVARTNCHLQVLVDDNLFPSYSSGKIKNQHHVFGEFGDVMIRELEFSQITLRLVESVDLKGEKNEKETLAKITGSTLSTLQRGLYTPTTIELRDSSGKISRITVSLKYIPIRIQLPARDSFHNQGVLRVHAKRGTDLPAADRNGYSDPFCKFILNDNKIPVYKTDKIKKTLNPEWNESFEVDIRSRVDDLLTVDVYDWDFGEKDDFLGRATIPLADIIPFQSKTMKLALDGKSGEVELDVIFKSSFVTRSRLGSSTFQGKTFTAPVSVVASGVKGVGKLGVKGFSGIGTVGSGVMKMVRSKGANGSTEVPSDMPLSDKTDGASVRNSIVGDSLSPTHARHKSIPSSVASQTGLSQVGSSGTISMSFLSLQDGPAETSIEVSVLVISSTGKHKQTVAVKGKTAKDGSFKFKAGEHSLTASAATQFKLVLSEHHTLRANVTIGEGIFVIPDQGTEPVAVSVPVSSANMKALVKMQVQFVPADDDNASVMTPSRRRASIMGRPSP